MTMKNTAFTIRKAGNVLQWLRIYFLYRAAFPASERKPFFVIAGMCKRGRSDVWYAQADGRFAGFAEIIPDGDLVLLDYLAVRQKLRGKGVGSDMLRALAAHYVGRGMFVEIENAFADVPDRRQRLRRKHFYQTNGFVPMRVMAEVFGVEMELLALDCRVDFARYHAFYRDNLSAFAAKNIVEKDYPREGNE